MPGQTLKGYEFQVGTLLRHIRLHAALRHNNRTELHVSTRPYQSIAPLLFPSEAGFFFFVFVFLRAYDFKRERS